MDFRKYLVDLRDTLQKPVILAGDLNVAHKEIDINDSNISVFQLEFIHQERCAFQTLLNLGFIDTYRHLYPLK